MGKRKHKRPIGLADLSFRIKRRLKADGQTFRDKEIKAILETAFEEIKLCLDAEEPVLIRNFGRLYTGIVKRRGTVNPQTRERVILPETRFVRIKPSGNLIKFLNED